MNYNVRMSHLPLLIFAWQAFVILPFCITSHVPQSPFLHEYVILTLAAAATCETFWPATAFTGLPFIVHSLTFGPYVYDCGGANGTTARKEFRIGRRSALAGRAHLGPIILDGRGELGASPPSFSTHPLQTRS